MYDETYDWSYQEDEQMVDIDEFLDNYTLFLENGDDVPSNTNATMDEFLCPILMI